MFVEQSGTSKYSLPGPVPRYDRTDRHVRAGQRARFHIPYLYDFSGQPWKTQRRVRQMMDVWYGDGPLGIPGDDDGGAMSSWYVLSAMGFYPVCPGSPAYEIGSPLFAESAIRLDNGKVFTIVAVSFRAEQVYPVGPPERQAAGQAVVPSFRSGGRRHADSGDGAGAQYAVGQRARGCAAFHDGDPSVMPAAGERDGNRGAWRFRIWRNSLLNGKWN